jgi:tyrosinase
MDTVEPVTIGRLARVREILAAAFTADAADFGGIGPFWELPLPELLAAELYGVRLIASREDTPSCCGSRAKRSTRSGVIQALRGVAPFDGVLLPSIPAIPDETSIQIVAQWIDDDCPPDAKDIEYSLGAGAITVESAIPAEQLAAGTYESSTEYVPGSGELRLRVNIDCMTRPQLEQLRDAFRELYELNKWPNDARSYNNLSHIHQNHCQHGWERFLPWHRVYLYEFEQALLDRSPGVAMPYWDWTMPQYRPEKPEQGWIIPPAFKAYLTESSLVFLTQNGIPTVPLKKLVGQLFTRQSEFFAAVAAEIGDTYIHGEPRERFIDALLDANALWYPLRYPAQYFADGKPGTINQVIHYHYPSADDMEQILSLRTFRDFGGGSSYNDAFGFIDQNPHNTMHIWTGGMNPQYPGNEPPVADRNRGVKVAGRQFHKREDLYSQPQYGDMFSNLTAAYDPIFWSIHVNVDRLWWEWQERHPDGAPADLDSVLTPWSYTMRDTLDIHRFGYEYQRGAFMIPVGLGVAVGRFAAKPIPIADTVSRSFRRAEVRLQRVPQLPRSCFVRVFLNLPDANAATPLDHLNYAGYFAIFGHGPCYGGPGHCDLPGQRRQYDLRPRDHNTPRNHRVDVTKCARRLFEAGASEIQISLVVIGADYQEERELLRMEGVSLNFLD